MSTHLITGATGHIGNVLARELIARGKSVRAMLLPGEDATPINDLPVELVEGDVLDFGSLQSAFEGVDMVYHLAGLISILPGKDPMVQTVNVLGTRNVIRAARQAGVRRLVYTSSIHALQRVPHGILIDENIPFDTQHAISAYDHSKAQASLEVLKAVQEGLDAVIACPTGVIGPYDFRRSEMGGLIADCLKNRLMFYVEGAYDFVDVRDVAAGLVLVGEQGHTGQSYILSGERITVHEIFKSVQKIVGHQQVSIKIPLGLARLVASITPLLYRLTHIKPRFTPYSLATLASNSVISHAKAVAELGYAPRPLRESIADTIRWFKQQRRLDAA